MTYVAASGGAPIAARKDKIAPLPKLWKCVDS